MVDVSAIAGAISGLKALKDIVESMVAVRDAKTFIAKVGELNAKMIETQALVFEVNKERSALIDRVKELEEQIVRMETWSAEKQRYELRQVSKFPVFAYVAKPEIAGNEPLHCICAACYDAGKKSILHATSTLSGNRERLFHCHTCSVDIPIAASTLK